jgi:hypothetical protein
VDLTNFKYREEKVKISEIFPQFSLKVLQKKFPKKIFKNPHEVIFQTTLSLWGGGYDFILDNFGFHDRAYAKFSGHCHQITPALGLVLLHFGFKVAYLECARVDLKTGEMISPEEEKSEMKEEFCSIGRIPYCCLEVKIKGEKFYLTGKHLTLQGGVAQALLTPDCYQEMIGVFSHQFNNKKSGIYLKQVKETPFIWIKQKQDLKTGKPIEEKEYFKTFVYMELVFD